MEIKPIPDIPEKIIEASGNGNLVIFIGAGISMCGENRCPSWNGLASKILEHIYKNDGINFKEKKISRLKRTLEDYFLSAGIYLLTISH